jgi:hypothetical protein
MEAASTVSVCDKLSYNQQATIAAPAAERDIENQQVICDIPQRRPFSSPTSAVEAEPVQSHPSTVIQSSNVVQPPDIIFVEPGMGMGGPSYVYYVGMQTIDDPHEGWLWCAITGCVFSWIPIVGCITFCFNSDAPFGTLRRKYSSLALSISFLSLCFNLLFWPLWFI